MKTKKKLVTSSRRSFLWTTSRKSFVRNPDTWVWAVLTFNYLSTIMCVELTNVIQKSLIEQTFYLH